MKVSQPSTIDLSRFYLSLPSTTTVAMYVPGFSSAASSVSRGRNLIKLILAYPVKNLPFDI